MCQGSNDQNDQNPNWVARQGGNGTAYKLHRERQFQVSSKWEEQLILLLIKREFEDD